MLRSHPFHEKAKKKGRPSVRERGDPKAFGSSRRLLSICENHCSNDGQDGAQFNRKVNRKVDFDLAFEA